MVNSTEDKFFREKRKQPRACSLMDDSLLGATEDPGYQGTTTSHGAVAGSAGRSFK